MTGLSRTRRRKRGGLPLSEENPADCGAAVDRGDRPGAGRPLAPETGGGGPDPSRSVVAAVRRARRDPSRRGAGPRAVPVRGR